AAANARHRLTGGPRSEAAIVWTFEAFGGKVPAMAFEIEHARGLPADDASARLHAIAEYLENKHGLSVQWLNDDEATIHGKYLVVTIEGTVSLRADRVRFSGKDPGMLWRGKAKEYLQGKLAKYLNPSTPLDALPRR